MSGSPNRPGQRDGRNAPEGKRPEAMSLEDLLSDIEEEENKVKQQFSDLPGFLDDDFDDFGAPDYPDGFDEPENDIGDPYRVSAHPYAADDDQLTEVPDFDDDLDDPQEAPAGSGEADRDVAPAAFPDDDEKPVSAGKASSPAPQKGVLQDKNRIYPIIIIALLAVIVIILLMQNCGGTRDKQDTNDWYDTSAIEGTLPGKTPEEIQAMLNQIVEEGMFNISIAPVIVFEDARAKGQARIENVPANHYDMSVAITLDETGETIYQSKGIRPGQYIEYITLQKELQPGEHKATALFSAHDPETLGEQGRVAVKITIIVE